MAAGAACLVLLPIAAGAQTEGQFGDGDAAAPSTGPSPGNTVTPSTAELPPDPPRYFPPSYLSALRAPLPNRIYRQGGIPPVVPQLEVDRNPYGRNGSYQPGGATQTATNAFFQALGTNGRACVTCHQPPSGMSVSVANIKARFRATAGRDPIFAPVDGANCPNQVPAADTSGSLYGGLKGGGRRAFKAAHSLILQKGPFRIFLPILTGAEFTVAVDSDPGGCNTDPNYNAVLDPVTNQRTQIVSVYRRPKISANLKFIPGEPQNIMWDGREPSLESQAVNATLSHAQATAVPTAEEVRQIVQFENGIFSAQITDKEAKALDSQGARGGPRNLANADARTVDAFPKIIPFDEHDSWATATGNASVAASRQSISRGQEIFNRRTFTISRVAGLNDAIPGQPPVTGTCAACRSENHSDHDLFGSQVAGVGAAMDIGVGGTSTSDNRPAPAADLPIFTVSCTSGQTPFHGTVVRTNDSGKALISGKCADIGKFAIPSPRALAAQAPYFHDGSAATLEEVVTFYDRCFAIGFSAEEKQDLVASLTAL